MPATMGTTDRPGPPDDPLIRPGPPDLVRVGRRDGFRSAFVAVVAVALLLGVAVWKPWETTGGATAHGTLRPDAGGGLVPAITERPADPDTPDPVPSPSAPTFSGLNLSVMGASDPHDAWGVALAYVSQIQLDNARLGGAPFVTPVVSWELIEPGHAMPGPVLDHRAVTSVAVAATWPTDVRPVSIHLYTFGPLGPLPSPRRSAAPSLGSEVLLPPTLEQLLHGSISTPPLGALGSGAFFMSSPVPGLPTSWADHGWPPGRYAFIVDLGGGHQVSLPFVIAATLAS